jgi:Spy/CpxP family protein refolding chaperone
MGFSSDRRKAAALVALVFVLGIAFGVVGVLAGRRVLSAGNRGNGNGNGNGQDQQLGQLTRDLNLTTDQERQFRQILADERDRYDAVRKEMDPQLRQVREQNRERIQQILTAEQRTEFDAFMRESRNRRNDQNNRRNDQANRNDQPNRNDQVNRNDQTPQVTRLTQELHLTADQQTQLSGILRDTRASFDALRQQMNPQFEEARQQSRDRMRQAVTSGQRQGLESFFQRRDEERRRR